VGVKCEKMLQKQNMLTKPLAQLSASNDFLAMAISNHFQNLQEILQYPVYKLMELNGFNYHTLDELIEMLNEYGLQDKLKEV
jgi:hypothetical protein